MQNIGLALLLLMIFAHPLLAATGIPPGVDSAGSLLHEAVLRQDSAALSECLAQGAAIEHRGQDEWTALHLAAARGWTEGLSLLRESGADHEVRDRYGWTPLHLVAANGHVESARALLEAGAEVDATDNRGGLTPLFRAGLNGHADLVSLLLNRGADPDARSTARGTVGMTPLHWAAGGVLDGNTEAVRRLLEAGADVALADQVGMTALHWAVLANRSETARLLIEAGAPLGACDDRGQSPLHFAVAANGLETVALLVETGSDVDVKDAQNASPADLGWRASASVRAILTKPRANQLPKEGWRFRADPGDVGVAQGWHRADLDETGWEAIQTETPWTSGYIGVGWYRRSLRLPEAPPDARTARLRFEGVDECALVWVNGSEVGGQDIGPAGWNQAFEVDVTDFLRWNASNQIAIRVWNTTGAGGIWRPILLNVLSVTEQPVAVTLP